MRNRLLIVGASLLVLSACGDNAGSNVSATAGDVTADAGNLAGAAVDKVEDTTAAAVGMASAPMANTADAYVTNAAISDLYEIQSSKLALEKSQSAAVKKFAQQMVTDHTGTTAKLKATLAEARLQITPPTQLDPRRQGMVDNLQKLSGAAFDKAYIDQQTAAHQEAVTLHSGFAEDGDNPALKQLAAATTPKIQHHAEMVKQIDATGADGTR